MHVERPGVGAALHPTPTQQQPLVPPKEAARREERQPTKDGEDSGTCPAWFCPHPSPSFLL